MTDQEASMPVQHLATGSIAVSPSEASYNVPAPPQKIYWWEEPLLTKDQMTAEELARPYNPYYKQVAVPDNAVSSESAPIGRDSMIHGDSTPPVSQNQQLGSLHQRRANLSPKKFDKGRFEPQSIVIHPAGSLDRPASSLRMHTAGGLSTGLTAGLQRISMTSHSQSHKTKPAFSMLESLCDSHDVLLFLISYLTLPDILNLYAISKRFHFLWNANYVAYIKASLRTWAPGAEEIFPWACYKNLCIKDPYVRQKSKWEGNESQVRTPHEDKRDVPSLRWLQMVVYRQGVSLDILIQMALKGLRCVPKTSDAVKRLWFLMDLPLNSHRIALMRSETYISNRTLLSMTGFMLKLDMFFTDPFGQPFPPASRNRRMYPPAWASQTFTGVDMREYLLAERSLTPLWRVLRGWSPDPTDPQIPMTRLDVLRLWARHKYQFPADMPEPMKKMSFMGVPWWQIGTARLERVGLPKHELAKADSAEASVHPLVPLADPGAVWVPTLSFPPTDRVAAKLHDPCELVMLEGIRRRMNLHLHWLPMVAWGLHDGLGRPFPELTEKQMNRILLGNAVPTVRRT